MILLNVGPKSSASTWVSVIISEIIARFHGGQEFVRTYADSLNDVWRYPKSAECHMLIKSHHPRNDLCLLAKTGAAKVVMTMRDPRDCIASLMQRFDNSFEDSYRTIESSFAHIDPLSDAQALLLRYEDEFMNKVGTVEALCKLLQVKFDKSFAEGLIHKFEFDNMKKYTEAISTLPAHLVEKRMEGLTDRKTGFFAKHLSDGVIGKYADVLGAERSSLINARMGYYLNKYQYPTSSQTMDISCFSFGSDFTTKDQTIYISAGSDEQKCLVYGPYVNLPTGHWTAKFLVRSPSRSRFTFDVAADERPISMSQHDIGVDVVLHFFNGDPRSALEFRVHTIPQGRTPELFFSGVELSRKD